METRANYLLIGAFTLAVILGALGFFIWLAKVQIDKQYAYYDVLFDNVSGLSKAAGVRFNGLLVGQVTDIELYAKDPTKVQVRIEVAAKTPIKTDTAAQLQSQGVTGVSFVSLTGGSAASQLLRKVDPTVSVPVIEGRKSVVEQLTQDAPDLLNESISLVRSLKEFVSPENQKFLTTILKNLDHASGGIESAMSDFSAISKTVSSATSEFTSFTGRLDDIGTSVQSSLKTADESMIAAKGAFAEAETALASTPGLVTSAANTFDSADALIKNELPGIIKNLSAAAQSLQESVTSLGPETGTAIASFTTTSDLAGARLAQLDATITDLNNTLAEAQKMLASANSASQSITSLVDGGGKSLVASANATLQQVDPVVSTINRVVSQDVPVIFGDIRETVQTANTVIDQAGTDITSFTGQFAPLAASADATLQAATKAFNDSGTTLSEIDAAVEAIETTLAGTDKTMQSIDAASTSFRTLIDGDAAGLVADARATLGDLEQSVAAINGVVTNDVPAIITEVRTAVGTTNRVIDQVGRDVTSFSATLPPLTDDAQAALKAATVTFKDASGTLARLDTAIGTAEQTLDAASTTFNETNRIIDTEVAPTAADIRSAARQLEASISQVSDDLPQITAEARDMLAKAGAAADTLDRVIRNSGAPIQDFAQKGLPQFTQLTQEARNLVVSLERLTRRIERDPARFFIGNQPTEYRR